MSIKFLPAGNLAGLPPASGGINNNTTNLATLTQRRITAQNGRLDLAPSTNAFAWPSFTRQGRTQFIHGTVVENAQSEGGEESAWEYVSGWAGSQFVEKTALAHYLLYATGLARWSGRLIDLYA